MGECHTSCQHTHSERERDVMVRLLKDYVSVIALRLSLALSFVPLVPLPPSISLSLPRTIISHAISHARPCTVSVVSWL